VCYPDGACGVPSEQACASDSQCRSGSCISGFCANPGAEVRGNGGLRCAVTATSAASNETSPAWLFGLALTLAVSRRRKAARTTHTNANAQR
jgi:MYXO-CTERM domain-containing protein